MPEEFEHMPLLEELLPLQRIDSYLSDGDIPPRLTMVHQLADKNGKPLPEYLPANYVNFIVEATTSYAHDLSAPVKQGGKRGRLLGSILIPLKPVTKKNSQQIVRNGNRQWIAQSRQYNQLEHDVLRLGNTIWVNPPRIKTPISRLVTLQCIFYTDINYSTGKAKADLNNYVSAINDILVKAKILSDDCVRNVIHNDGSRLLYDKEDPRTEVKIYAWEFPT